MRFAGRPFPATLLTAIALTVAVTGQETTSDPVRGLWVLRDTLGSPEAIDAMVRSARAAGVNTLLVQVRGRGEAFYESSLEPRASALDAQHRSFDPLSVTLDRAHAAGLRVHAWVNVNLVASGTTLPRSRRHVAARHPEWLMVPRELAGTLAGIDPQTPAYTGALARWTRNASADVEGLFLSPLVPAAQAHTVAVVRELVERYPVDGLHLDYVRFPRDDFDFSRAALDEFRRTVASAVPPADRIRLDRAAQTNPAAWADGLPALWRTFREQRLSTLVAAIAANARRARPGLTLSAAVMPDIDAARERHLQDWAAWATDGYLDVLCPMVYTTDADTFSRQVAIVDRHRGRVPMWVGIGAYRLPPAQTSDRVRVARAAGAAGVLLFSYDSLATADASSADYFDAVRPALLEASGAGTSH